MSRLSCILRNPWMVFHHSRVSRAWRSPDAEDIEEVDVGQVQKLDELAISPHWRPIARRRRRAKLPIMLPVLAIGVALGVSCFANGRWLAGLWLTAGSLSWAFLLGAADASERCSRAPEVDDEARIDASIGDDHAKG